LHVVQRNGHHRAAKCALGRPFTNVAGSHLLEELGQVDGLKEREELVSHALIIVPNHVTTFRLVVVHVDERCADPDAVETGSHQAAHDMVALA